MCDKNTGDTHPCNHFTQPAAQLLPYLGIYCGKWFIQQEQLRLRCQCTGKCNALALSAGKLIRIPLCGFFQPHKLQHFFHSCLDFCLGPFLYPQTKGNVFIYRQITEQRIILKDKSNAPLARRDMVDNVSINQNVAGVLCFQSCQHTQDGGLDAAAGTQQTDQLAFFYTKMDIFGCLKGAKAFVHAPHLHIIFLFHQLLLVLLAPILKYIA